jgi:hypothetical protein
VNSFYEALPYVLILGQALCPVMIARRHVLRRSAESKWAVALIGATPIPLLVAGLAIFAFIDIVVDRSSGCSSNGCASDREAFITLIVGALALFLFGIFNGFIGYWMGKNSLKRRQSE